MSLAALHDCGHLFDEHSVRHDLSRLVAIICLDMTREDDVCHELWPRDGEYTFGCGHWSSS